VTAIQELRETIRLLHGADATHVESVAVKETFQGKTVWEGIVEVFDLHGHAMAPRVYAWTHDTTLYKWSEETSSNRLARRVHYVGGRTGQSSNRSGVWNPWHSRRELGK